MRPPQKVLTTLVPILRTLSSLVMFFTAAIVVVIVVSLLVLLVDTLATTLLLPKVAPVKTVVPLVALVRDTLPFFPLRPLRTRSVEVQSPNFLGSLEKQRIPIKLLLVRRILGPPRIFAIYPVAVIILAIWTPLLLLRLTQERSPLLTLSLPIG